MTKEEYSILPKELEKYVDKAYGGLFGSSVQAKVVEEIVADPFSDYRPKDLQEMTGKSSPSIRNALNTLTSLKLLKKDDSDKQHPVYKVNLKSKQLTALTFLAYASLDDRDKTEHMDEAILNYFFSSLMEKYEHRFSGIVQHEFPGGRITQGLIIESDGYKSGRV